MKKLITIISLSLFSLCVCAQEEKKTTVIQLPQWVQDIKLSGYGMLQYQAHDKPGGHDNSFNLRLARLSLEGRILQDFYWKVQMQINGNTSSLGSSPRLVDLFGEWQRYSSFKVKAGQFKRPFSFENPMHPITQGFMSYSQNVTKLTGHSDRTGEHPSNGRDIGLQFQGDFLKIRESGGLVGGQAEFRGGGHAFSNRTVLPSLDFSGFAHGCAPRQHDDRENDEEPFEIHGRLALCDTICFEV